MTNTNNAGTGSLRAAITGSNAASGQTNMITFNIAGSGVHTISLQSALPAITTPVVIDATTIPGYTATPLIGLDGEAAGMGSDGLMVAATAVGTVIKGLGIRGFSGVGVDVRANNVVLSANEVGTNSSGNQASPNLGGGVVVRGSFDLIGGLNVLNPNGTVKVFKGNVISGNNGVGLAIEGNSNLVEGNFIGVSATGNDAVGNTGTGLVVAGSSFNTVGGTAAGAGNVISGNGRDGIAVDNTIAPPVTPYSVSAGPLTLTQTGINQGFSLATFATNFYTKANVGPAGITFPASGGVLADDGWGYVYKFPTDQNGQNAGNVPRVTYGTNLIGMAELNGRVYMVQKTTGEVLELDDSGNMVGTVVSGLDQPNGLIPDLVPGPLYGHLLISSDSGRAVYDVDPVARTKTILVNLDNGADGLAVAGNTLYVAENVYGVVGYDLGTKQKVFDSGPFTSAEGMPDGISVGTGDLRLNVFINTNAGAIIEIYTPNPTAHIAIAHLGSRGDLTAVDPYDGTLLLSQSDQIDRLIPPAGSGFAGAPAVATTNNLVEGNLVGLGLDRRTLLGNRLSGVLLSGGTTGNTIGGAAVGQGNTIVANGNFGVVIVDGGTTNNNILGNGIGTDPTGALAAGNALSGIWFGAGAAANAASGNLIANNAEDGVTVYLNSTVGNSIEANRIYNNTGLGIDLGNDGVTNNDASGHSGPNHDQDFPVLSAIESSNTATTVTGTFDEAAEPNTTLLIEFYTTPSADPSGHGQATALLGSTTITTNASGHASFTVPNLTIGGSPVPVGASVTATATVVSSSAPGIVAGDTSEFAADATVSNPVLQSVTVNAGASTTTPTFGQSVTFTATVAPVSGSGTPTGTVVFKDGAVTIDTENLGPSGQASFSTSTLAAGAHVIGAGYSGDTHYQGLASSPFDVNVSRAYVAVQLQTSTASTTVGKPVTLTATVAGPVGLMPRPTGTVVFKNGSTTLDAETLGASGQVSFTTSLPLGANSITAVFAGDTNYLTNASMAETVTIIPLLLVTNVSPSTNFITSLPSNQIVVTFNRILANLVPDQADGSGFAGAPFAVMLIPSGPDGLATQQKTGVLWSAPSGVDSGDLPIPATAVYHVNADGTSTITLTPQQPLATDIYLITVNAVTDAYGDPLAIDAAGTPGNVYASFDYRPVTSADALQVTGVTTQNGSVTVNDGSKIAQPDTLGIAFNKPLDPYTVNPSTVQLLAVNGSNTTPVASSAVYSPTTDTVYLTPEATLSPGTTYEVSVSGSVTDDQGFPKPGFPLGAAFTRTFTVSGGPPARQSPLIVVNTSPAKGTLFSAPLGYVSVTFSEPLNTTLANSILTRFSAMLISHTGGVTTGGSGYADVPLNAKLAFNPNTNQLVIVPTGLLKNGTIYLFSLSGIKAANGDVLQRGPQYASFEWQTGGTAAMRPSVAADEVALLAPAVTAAIPGGPSTATIPRRASIAQAVPVIARTRPLQRLAQSVLQKR